MLQWKYVDFVDILCLSPGALCEFWLVLKLWSWDYSKIFCGFASNSNTVTIPGDSYFISPYKSKQESYFFEF